MITSLFGNLSPSTTYNSDYGSDFDPYDDSFNFQRGSEDEDEDEDSDSEFTRQFIPTPKPLIQHNSQHILEMSIGTQTEHLRNTFTDLKINKNNAHQVFKNLNSNVLTYHKTTVEFLNRVGRLTIEDIEAAVAIASALDPSYLQRHNANSKDNCNHHSNKIFTKVNTIVFGPDFIHSACNSSQLEHFNIQKIFSTLGCSIKPFHLCLVASPEMMNNRINENPYSELPGIMSSMMNKWNIKSYTAHNFWFYEPESIPTSVESINIIFADCPATIRKGAICRCFDNFGDGIGHFFSTDPPLICPEITKKKLKLVNLPHCPPHAATADYFKQMVVRELEYDFSKDDWEKFEKGWGTTAEWINKDFSIVRTKYAGPCNMCGNNA